MTVRAPLWTVCALFTLGTLVLHLLPGFSSMFTLDVGDYDPRPHFIAENYLEANVELHRTEPAFARRPLTTWFIDGVVHSTRAPVAHVFIGVQIALLFLSGLMLLRLTSALGLSRTASLWSLVSYHLCFPVLCAWFPPIYSYDEGLQYTALFLALAELHRRRWAGFAIAFTIAMCVRESSLLLLPGIGLFLSDGAWRPRTWLTRNGAMRLAALLLPVVAFVAFARWIVLHLALANATGADLAARFSYFEHNFASAGMTWETFIYLYLVFGIPFALLLTTRGNGPRSWERAFLVSLVLNTVVVLVCTKAREARLFMLPLVLLWPWMGERLATLTDDDNGWRMLLPLLRKWEYALVLLMAMGCAILVMDRGWDLSDGNASGNPWHEYFLAQTLVLILAVLVLRHRLRRTS
jgi:hypothetical protein